MTHSPINKRYGFENDDDDDLIEDNLNRKPSSRDQKPTCPPVRAQYTPWYWNAKIIKAYDPALWWKGSKRTERTDKKGRSQPVGFEKPETCKRKQRFRINALMKGDDGMKALAKVLNSCRRGSRCGSLACPVCMRRMRRVIVSNALYGIQGLKPQFHSTLALEEYLMMDHSDLGNVDKLRNYFRKTKRKMRRKWWNFGRMA